jgi:ureidoglycolate dehydrogenase (NAD+)
LSEITVNHDVLKERVVIKLEEAGVPSDQAQTVAEVLVHADLRGVHSHGVLRTEHYVKRVTEGGLNPNPTIKVKETGPVSALVDGDDGFGHVVAKKAMEVAIELAHEKGVGFVGVENSSHCGALSYFLTQAAKENLIGIAMTHTDKIVVPFGGAKPYFGTNPIAFGVPTKKGHPVILDMATSEVAFGKILHAKDKGSHIPPTWGVDTSGQPTTDPNQVTSLLPFGGAKGYGLAMVVEIFSGLLTGSAFGPHVKPMYGNYNEMRKLGHFMCAIHPSVFNRGDSFLEAMDQMIDEIHQVQPAKGFERVMVPGEPEQLKEERYLKEGIPVPETVYDYLTK